ncbi:MAG: excinuclease ABC subunit UvrA [Deltaproteobacteria bacterium]|nr:excinuclease ABC subunit UvrA [Deltaproteobacteria bacterium]
MARRGHAGRHERKAFVEVRGARHNNLKDLDVDIPRDALVVFTGVSGSGKSSLAFGTIYAEAQRRYLDSVAPYARRLIDQAGAPEVDTIEGLPPAVALQQQRGTPTTRSSVGSVTTLSSSLRMLYSRVGDYPRGQSLLYADSFSPNTPAGACPTCHGLGRVLEVSEGSLVPDPSLTIRERAIAAWPPAWHGQNLRDILVTLGHDVDVPWRSLPKKTREWILFTDEQPVVPVYAGFTPAETRRALRHRTAPSYMGTYTSARRYVLQTYATTQSAMMKKRASRFLLGGACPACGGKRLQRAALSVTFDGLDIAELSALPLRAVAERLRAASSGRAAATRAKSHPERAQAATRITVDLLARIETIERLGLGYLSVDRSTPTLSPGELQRLRIATQLRSKLFGVVYVLDEPSAGLHPADTEALLEALEQLRDAGNSVFVVEHELEVIRRADWIVDVGPEAGENGGHLVYSGPRDGLAAVPESKTGGFLFGHAPRRRTPRGPRSWLRLSGIHRNNLRGLSVDVPLGVLVALTGVSGSGKSTLVQVLVDLVSTHLGREVAPPENADELLHEARPETAGHVVSGLEAITRLVEVDQKPIGRTPRSNLATYTGLFDAVRRLFAATKTAKARRYDAARFSFNSPKGRCETCAGEGVVYVELLFMPSAHAPCPTCRGARYDPTTLEVEYRGRNIAHVLAMTVDEAFVFFEGEGAVQRPLQVLREVGVGYLRLGQPATELSGGEAQRIKLATELQRVQRSGTLYVLDEPTTGLHPADVERLLAQLERLVDAGNTVLLVEHDQSLVAACDWVIDLGPGAGDEGGRVVATGPPQQIAREKNSRTAPWLAAELDRARQRKTS